MDILEEEMEEIIASPAAQVIVAIIPIVGIVIGGVVVFFYLLWRHREISLQIKTGHFNPKPFDFRLFSLFTGVLLTGIGFVLSLILYLAQGISYSVLGGLLPLTIGICLIVFYKVYPKSKENDREE